MDEGRFRRRVPRPLAHTHSIRRVNSVKGVFFLRTHLYAGALRADLSAQARRRSKDLTPAASTTCASAAPCWPIRRRIWSREHRASCGERMRDRSGPRARVSAVPPQQRRLSCAALRSTRRASATFKRGAPQGALERRRRWHFCNAPSRDHASRRHLHHCPLHRCPPRLKRPPPLLDPSRRLSCRHARTPSVALVSIYLES